VDNLPGFDGPTLARLDEARLDVSWLPLFVGRVHIARVRLDGVMAHLAIDENGVSNYGDLVPRRALASQVPEQAPFVAAVRRIDVSNGSATYFDAPRSRSLAIMGVDADATLSAGADGGWRAEIALESDSLHARMASVSDGILRMAGPTGKFSAVGDSPLNAIELEGGYIALADDTLAVRGRIAGLTDAEPSFDFLLTNSAMSARALAAVFPADVRSSLLPRAEGTLAVTLQVQGGLAAADDLVMHGAVRLDDVTLRLRGDIVAEHVAGVVRVDASTISLDSLAGRLAGGPFELSGTVARDSLATAALLARAQPDLDALDRLGLLPRGTTLSGNAALDVSLVGPLRALDSLDVVGEATLAGFQLKHVGLGAPVYVPAGVVTLSGRQVNWSDLNVLVGTDRLMTSGTIDDLAGLWSTEDALPRIDARLTGTRLDLDAIFPPVPQESASTYSQIAFAHLGGRSLEGRSANAIAGAREFSRPRQPPALGVVALRVDTLVAGPHRLIDVSARLELADSAISIPEASFGVWGGTARASLSVGIGPAAQQPFALDLSVEDAAAASFFDVMTPVGDAVSGTLHLQVALTGSTDGRLLPGGADLVGRGRIAVDDGQLTGTGVNAAIADFLEATHWSDIPFARWESTFEVRNRMIEFREANLIGPMGRMVLSGVLDFSGFADMSVALSVPADQLQGVSLRRTGIGPTVIEQLRIAGRPLDLGFRVSGPIEAPSLEPDAANAVVLARR
jgi:hypothetical protein